MLEISEKTMEHLKNNSEATADLDFIINQVHTFVQANDANISTKLRDRIFRFMKDLHESLENLHAINTHRTPLSLKAYCKLFIYIFPFVYAPTIISNVTLESPHIVTYFVVVLTEFILISLYNIQDQLEFPFDDDGLDDIKIEAFKLDR